MVNVQSPKFVYLIWCTFQLRNYCRNRDSSFRSRRWNDCEGNIRTNVKAQTRFFEQQQKNFQAKFSLQILIYKDFSHVIHCKSWLRSNLYFKALKIVNLYITTNWGKTTLKTSANLLRNAFHLQEENAVIMINQSRGEVLIKTAWMINKHATTICWFLKRPGLTEKPPKPTCSTERYGVERSVTSGNWMLRLEEHAQSWKTSWSDCVHSDSQTNSVFNPKMIV